jgi:hypothetical protein
LGGKAEIFLLHPGNHGFQTIAALPRGISGSGHGNMTKKVVIENYYF